MAREKSEQYYFACDCETGGLNPKESDLLTFYGAIVDENFKVLEELNLKLKPDNRLPIAQANALRVNGINIQQHLEDPETITYSKAKEQIVTLLKKYLKKRGRFFNIIPLGYNVEFDIGYIQEYLLPKNEWDSLLHYRKVDPKVLVDFFKKCDFFPPDLGTLTSVVSFLNIQMGEAHTAKADTLATVEVYKRMIDIMKSKKDGGQSQDLISLLEAE